MDRRQSANVATASGSFSNWRSVQPSTSLASDANWTSETVVSPVTRSPESSSTRSAIRSSAPAKRALFRASLRIDAEKSRTSATSELSGVVSAAEADCPPPDARSRPQMAMAMAMVRDARWSLVMLTMCKKDNLVAGARSRDGSQVGPPAHASRVLRCWIVVSSGRPTTQPVPVPRVNEMDVSEPNEGFWRQGSNGPRHQARRPSDPRLSPRGRLRK